MISFDKIAPRICDCHVHYGQFREDFFDVVQVNTWIEELGIDKVGIMPVGTTQESDFNCDANIMATLSSEHFVPYLWISPEMIDIDPTFGNCDILSYKVIKIHTYARREWLEMPEKICAVIETAYKKNIPVMFHTGGSKDTNAIQFYKYCCEYPEVTFILAHGRPISQALTILKGSKNSFVDTAFMPNDSIKALCDAGLSSRIIFGTDFPIMKTFWPEINLLVWYRNNVMDLIGKFGEKNFMVWAYDNFCRLILKSGV